MMPFFSSQEDWAVGLQYGSTEGSEGSRLWRWNSGCIVCLFRTEGAKEKTGEPSN